VSETATAADSVLALATFFAIVTDGAAAVDQITARFLWEIINDSQTANWGTIDTAQASAWTTISDTQTASWGTISNAQPAGWTTINDAQGTSWDVVKTQS
jgi:hypothetical protein